ncbi:hypothetical protein C9374_008926 [Naegleria lovaniensis]|uniref:protein-histidine N-methyltransferase n=1 Tax=Naegleria lovaniensis TaxID=51637 RepID=A0AA88GJZ8_NAELO|nr:uncharacterized protein C9374_008926 [Naegleria lovaniensis]KAG2377841.1 hypothetical protein C9374_008926 [Naegleria lovaniensis]
MSDSAIFRFNFSVDDDDEMSDDADHTESTNVSFHPSIITTTFHSSMNNSSLSSEDTLPFEIVNIPKLEDINYLKQFSIEWRGLMKYINITTKLQHEQHISQTTNSDIVKNKYEGGFKLWECSEDLVEFLMNDSKFVNDNVKNRNVLELGCGHALPSIYCLLQGGAKKCAFQDYNKEVIQLLTIPNLLLNISQHEIISTTLDKCQFFSGDWSKMSEHSIIQKDYDLIMMSDTIYSVDSYDKLYRVIRSAIRPGGKLLVGAKSYYFGCGGSTQQFINFVKQKDPHVQIETLKDIRDGVSNVREILLFTFE